MKMIIAATDFSPAATHAATYAAAMAMALGADLFLLHAYEPPASYGEISFPIDFGNWEQDAQATLRALQHDLERQTNGLVKVGGQVHLGSFHHELSLVCEELKPYAVVIGMTGKTAAERALFGSNAVHTLKHLPWPVIAVPQNKEFSGIWKIGLASELEQVTEIFPFPEIELLLKDFKAELHVLNVGSKTVYDPEVKFASQIISDKLKAVKLQFHFLSDGDIDQGIIDFAEKMAIDLLIVLPKRRSFIDALLHRSHTRQFVLHSHVPVMALHTAKSY